MDCQKEKYVDYELRNRDVRKYGLRERERERDREWLKDKERETETCKHILLCQSISDVKVKQQKVLRTRLWGKKQQQQHICWFTLHLKKWPSYKLSN